MNLLPASFDTKIASDYLPSVNLNSYRTEAMDNYNHDIPLAAHKPLQNSSLQFASVLAHEVRNPLTTINLSVEMLTSAIKDNGLKRYLDIIKRSSVRINDLINEILKYQQADEAEVSRHSIHQLLDEVLIMVEDQIRLKSIAVTKDYAALDYKITLDVRKMKIALVNIIVNAIDAMITAKGHLNLVTKSIEDKYVIQIEDNGCGISAENLKNIFKPYYTNKPGGLGLGLATTYDILRSNYAEVHVESEESKGTRFILLFDKNSIAISL